MHNRAALPMLLGYLNEERQESIPDTRVALDTGAALNNAPRSALSAPHEIDDGIP